MGAVVVVGVGEFVEEALELVEAVGAVLGFEPFLEGLLETFDLRRWWGGWARSSSVRCRGKRGGPRRRCGRLSRRSAGWCRPMALSVRVDAGKPWSTQVWSKVSTTIGPVMRRWR